MIIFSYFNDLHFNNNCMNIEFDLYYNTNDILTLLTFLTFIVVVCYGNHESYD